MLAASQIADKSSKLSKLFLYDVAPLSLGIEVVGNIIETLIPRNTLLPVKRSKTFTTTVDNQTRVQVNVFEGVQTFIIHNHKIGTLMLDIKPAKKREEKITVTFKLDADFQLSVLVKYNGIEKNVPFAYKSLTETELKEILDSSNELLENQGKKRKHNKCEQDNFLMETLTITDDEMPAVCEESDNARARDGFHN